MNKNEEVEAAARKLAEVAFKCGWTLQCDWQDVAKAIDELELVFKKYGMEKFKLKSMREEYK